MVMFKILADTVIDCLKLLILFRSNHDTKKNALIVAIIYLIGITAGILFEIFNFTIIL